MATCVETINSIPYNSIQVLNPSTLTPFSFTTTNNKLFRFQSTTSTSVLFNFNFVPSGVITNIQISFYRYEGPSIAPVSLGYINIVDTSTAFSRDFTAGNFIVCIRSISGSYNANVVANFTTYPTTAFFQPRFYTGEQTSRFDIEIEPLPNPCDEPLFYEIVDGSLPPGIVMNSLGILQGTLPNLDCISETEEMSPSVNWYWTDTDGAYQPWGYRWRFKVKVFIASMPDVFSESWFCIKLHNNWDFDTENFLEQAPFDRTRQIEIVKDPETLPRNVCFMPCEEDEDTVVFVPKKLDEKKCKDCDGQPVEVVLVPIPPIFVKKPVSEIAQWYQENRDKIFSSPDMNEFAERLKQSEAWKIYIKQLQYNDTEQLNNGLNVNVSTLNGMLQISSTSIYRGEDLTELMERLRLEVNQTLPFTVEASAGETLSLTISTLPNV